MMITEKVEVSDEILARGGFADIRSGKYMEHPVAIKTMKVAENDDLLKIRKVRINGIFSVFGTQSRPFCSSNFARKSFSGVHYPIRTS